MRLGSRLKLRARFIASSRVVTSALALALATSDVRAEPAVVLPQDVVPEALLAGPHHRVESVLHHDGFLHTFAVTSRFGDFEVRGVDVLRVRVGELHAMAALDALAGTPAFLAAEEKSGVSPFATGGGLGRRRLPDAGPALLPGLPGASDFGSPGGLLGQLAGFGVQRREIAHRLGVDPYSPTPALAERLDRHGWVVHAGGGPLPDPQRVGAGAHDSERVRGLLRDLDEEDLERLNRIELAVMGVEEELREAFLDHPDYAPGHETALVEALAELEGAEDRRAFVEAAAAAGSSAEAHSFRRHAEMLRRYHADAGSLARVVAVDGQVAGVAEDGTMVVPVHSDHATWNDRMERFAETMAEAAGDDPDLARTHLLFGGSLSPRAREQMEALGLGIGQAPSSEDEARDAGSDD